MGPAKKSSRFTKSRPDPLGPPLIGALLRIPWETVRRHMLERLHERGFGDLDVAHLSVFQYPGPQGAKPSELAARLHASKQSINHLLGQLERFGYLERRNDPEDKRSRRIHLTPRGRSAGLTIREAVTEVEREWERRLGSERLAQLRALLRELSE
ncbi:MAG TPA: MarR family transcriptional regulator [Candidatus Eisenbacteria bacterium]|nr:MarR family transcriptional regulator [Candidatus Eisenbacteria bacterium]